MTLFERPLSLEALTDDPVVAAPDAQAIEARCGCHLARAEQLLEGVRALSEAPDAALSWESVMAPIDQLTLELSMAGGWPQLAEEVHPDAEAREAARACRPKIVKFQTEMLLDARLAGVVRRHARLGPELSGTRRRLLEDWLREFRRSGLELPAEGQHRLRQINDELSRLGQEFARRVSEATHVCKVRREQLAGLPEAFLRQHEPDAQGLVALTTDYPDYFPVLTYAEDREVARTLNQLFESRAAEHNVRILERVLALRCEKATLLGYPSWAAYAIEPRMARTPEAVAEFIARAAEHVREPALREYAEFQLERGPSGGLPEERIPAYDRMFLEQKLAQKKFSFDGKAFSEYLEVNSVVNGALGLAAELFGIELRELQNAPRWHPDVRVLEVVEEGATAGKLYLDLHPRDAKYKHGAMFEIRPGARLRDGSYLSPIAALVCNFPKPGTAAALLTLDEVQTLFHELGHVLHHLLTREELASYSGTNTAQDFVEVPSQVFEEWAFERAILDRFARHYRTGAPIPAQLFDAMRRSRAFGRALANQRQLALAALDFEYHVRVPPFDTDRVLAEVMARSQPFAQQANTHFQASFGHLMGYDAGYYSYQWSLAIARDVLSRFAREGLMSRQTARDWREQVLARGAGADERELVRAFLGRDTDLRAYSAYLAGTG